MPGTGADELQQARRSADWAGLLDTAGRHLVTPLLAGRLQEKDLFGLLPQDIGDYLEAIRELNRERNEILGSELLATIRRLNRVGVEPLLLKGAINLVSEQYPGCEDRVIGDLDLAVPAERLEQCFHELAVSPYQAHGEFTPEHSLGGHHHAPALLHESLPVCIELHHRVLGRQTGDILDTEEVWSRSTLHDGPGCLFRLPDVTSRLIHTFTHTQLQDKHHARRRLVLRPLCEFVDQRARFHAEVDWNLIREKLGKLHMWVLETYLLCARELFDQPEPEAVSIGFRARSRMPWIMACANYRAVRRSFIAAERLKRLPRRLVTPSWYPAKIRALRNGAPF